MTGLTKGEGAAISISHWKCPVNTSFDHISLRMAVLCIWLPRRGFLGATLSVPPDDRAAPARCDLRRAVVWPWVGRKRRLSAACGTFSLWFAAWCAQSLVTLGRRDSADHSPRGWWRPFGASWRKDTWKPGLALRPESATAPRSRACQLRLETGLPWNVFSPSLLVVFLKLYHFISL